MDRGLDLSARHQTPLLGANLTALGVSAIELLPECRELTQLDNASACFDGRDGAFGVALTAFANNENTQHRVVSVAVETFRMLRRWCEKGSTR